MAIKDLFRKRSKSRVRSGGSEYQSRSTTPTPGATLANAGGSPTQHNGGAGYQTSSPSYDRTSMNNPRSRASADVLDQTALPYRQQPAGEPPSRGATPLPGNATSESDRTRARSIGGGRSVDLNRPSQAASSSAYTGTTTTTGSSGTPGNFTTTTTTTTTTGSRPTSRSGARHAASRSQDAGHRYTSSDVPPRLPVADFSSRAAEAETAPSNLPIANEFSASTWSQRGASAQPNHANDSMPLTMADQVNNKSQPDYSNERNDIGTGRHNPSSGLGSSNTGYDNSSSSGLGSSNTRLGSSNGGSVQDTVKQAVGREHFGEQDPSHMNYRNGPSYANGGKADNFSSATSKPRGLAAQQGFSNNETSARDTDYSQQMPLRDQDALSSRTGGSNAHDTSARNTDYAQQMPPRTQDAFTRTEDSNAYSDAVPSQTSTLNHKRSMSIPRKSLGDVNTTGSAKQTLPTQDRNDWSMTGNSVLGAASREPSSLAGYTPSVSGDIRQGRQQIYKNAFTVEGAAQPPSLKGIVDLTNTVDTTTDIVYAPAIIQEVVHTTVHHIREEQYTREIHHHHIHERTQPVIDVQVLPAKHLVKNGDGPNATWSEIPAALVPGRPESHFVIAETVSKFAGDVDKNAMPHRHFTARGFGPQEGESRKYVSEAGVPTTEQTWIHPPRLAQAGRVAGETVPFPMSNRAEREGEGPGYVDGQGRVIVGGMSRQ